MQREDSKTPKGVLLLLLLLLLLVVAMTFAQEKAEEKQRSALQFSQLYSSRPPFPSRESALFPAKGETLLESERPCLEWPFDPSGLGGWGDETK